MVLSLSLRLKIYKGMGFEPVLHEDGQVAKMLICEQSIVEISR